ncbi:MAG: hypothetical protein KF894_25605 [Labilithrix sp.]|nr:hypothetical protein [Labilithrix sp.]
MRAAILACALACVGCTVHHSRTAIGGDATHVPPPAARFVSEDDSGLLIFGVLSLSEPDHYAVLLERIRRKHRCGRIAQAQLDFYTDHWLLVGFPVARVTVLCEPSVAPDARPAPSDPG